jgi:long-chain acyl-CoA synthetase
MEKFGEKDTYISYLPCSHSFEQDMFGLSVSCGVRIGFYSGDNKKIVEDLGVLKPTLFPTVPRLLNKIYSKI